MVGREASCRKPRAKPDSTSLLLETSASGISLLAFATGDARAARAALDPDYTIGV